MRATVRPRMEQVPAQQATLAEWLLASLAEFLRILRRDPPELLELAMAALALIWGIWLTLPWISVSPQAAAVGNLLTASTETTFGLVFIAVAIFKFVALAPGVSHRQTVRVLAAGVLLVAWMFVASQIWRINPTGTGVPVYSGLAAIQWFLFARQVARRARA